MWIVRHSKNSTTNFTSSTWLHQEFYLVMPYRGTCSLTDQSAGDTHVDGRLTGNGFLILPVMHFSATSPKLRNRLLLSERLFFQRIWQPLQHVFFAWLQLIFLPCYILYFT